jgi:DHA1 family tetracycline resistance protein-like MFS transporter
MAGIALLAVNLFALPMSGTVSILFVATAGVAVGHGLIASTLNGLASKAVSPHAQGRVLGLMQSAASLARIVGPVMGGWLLNHDATHLVDAFGRTPYWSAGLVMLAALALASAL